MKELRKQILLDQINEEIRIVETGENLEEVPLLEPNDIENFDEIIREKDGFLCLASAQGCFVDVQIFEKFFKDCKNPQ